MSRTKSQIGDPHESSKDPLNFNRTLIHRGYCVSSRCPLVPGQKFNDTRRFEECIAHWARMLDYKSTSVTIEFCKSAKQANITNNLDTSKTLFLVVILFILFCNVVGTIYDVQTSNVKKNPFVVCWSWKDNWRRLTAPSDDADPKRASLLPTHGFRVIILLLVMCIHCGLIHFKLYSQNPQYLEKMMRDPIILLTRNGTAVVCVFLMLSNFLLARRMLQQQVSVKNPFLMCLLHRIARISPLYLLNVWWAATWLKELGDGPLWISNIHAEADICWNKLWTHALFINNLVDTHNHCLVQTWFLAVDMQLYVVSCALILTLTTVRMKNLIILGMIFLASCLLNGTLSYVFGWKSMLFITNTENLRTVFKGVPSFINLYITPWGSLPTSIMGVSLAYLDIHLQETGFKFTEHKVLSWLHRFSIPLVIMTVWVGAQAVDAEGGGVLQAGYAALDRTVICAFAAILLLGMCNETDDVMARLGGVVAPVPACATVALERHHHRPRTAQRSDR
ncbi:unnamed protein product [Diatraea saccharalis]|uniref:Acyltransferase 3 domain-containing protein n=1 Tax=Diatraea saccharalis TaxID=40085 RepID=A0A9N9R807_9NEOP|nr:unnamed protein product [Diatraea saccharalis]